MMPAHLLRKQSVIHFSVTEINCCEPTAHILSVIITVRNLLTLCGENQDCLILLPYRPERYENPWKDELCRDQMMLYNIL